MQDLFNHLLEQYSDAELEVLASRLGPNELFNQLTKVEASLDVAIQHAREQFAKREERVLSDTVEDYFLDAKARFFVMNDGLTYPKLDENDKFADNMSMILTHFEAPKENSKSSHMRADYFMNTHSLLELPENKVIYDFLIATYPEYLKLLIYYGKVSSFEDLKTIFSKFDEHQNEIRNNQPGHYKDIPPGLSDAGQSHSSFVSALPAEKLEFIMQKTNMSSLQDYTTLFLDTPHMTTFLGLTSKKVLNYIMDTLNISTVEDAVTLASSKPFTYALREVHKPKKYLNNLSVAVDHFKITTLKHLHQFVLVDEIHQVMKGANGSNFEMLLDIADITSASELEHLCGNVVVSENIDKVDYPSLQELFTLLGIDDEKKETYFYELITHSYTEKTSACVQQLSSFLKQKTNLPTNLKTYILDLLHEEDYLEQNFASVTHLLQKNLLGTEEHVTSLTQLKNLLGGFVTPELSERYLQAENDEAKLNVLTSYQELMKQVLGSSAIVIEDASLTSEAIYLAYRPTGYSINDVRRLIHQGWGTPLRDLTSQLENIQFNKEGYPLQFNIVSREQKEEFDSQTLRVIDNPILSPSKKRNLTELITTALSVKPIHQDALPTLFGHILDTLNDDRIVAYRETYHSDKGLSHEYTEERLESLGEILGIIPHEDVFYTALTQFLNEDAELSSLIQDSANRYLWKKNKRHFTPEQRKTKTKLDEAIKHLKKDVNSDVSELLEEANLASLGQTFEALQSLTGSELYATLTEIQSTTFFGYGKEVSDPLDVFYQALLHHAKEKSTFVKREIRKIESIKSDAIAEATAVVSKNVGSYFAKAGAEICTSHNLNMWYEERHSHLNLVYKHQIIGNVMLYFEPERDYLIARGINPRRDTMNRFDRYSMASQIVTVLEDIAEANGYTEVFIPQQTAWHALSNRDGMAKEIMGISRKNINDIKKNYPDQRTTIENANFYVTNIGGHSINTLHLLTCVRKD